MPVFLIAAGALVAGIAQVPPWIAAITIAAVTAVGVMQTNLKLHALRHSAETVAARAPGAVLFGLFVYSLLIGLPYLIGIGIRSVAS